MSVVESEAMPEHLLTPNEVAEILHVHPNTVRRLSDRGDLPCHRLGTRRDRRYAPSMVRDYLARTLVR